MASPTRTFRTDKAKREVKSKENFWETDSEQENKQIPKRKIPRQYS
jgi:hypothetical protein